MYTDQSGKISNFPIKQNAPAYTRYIVISNGSFENVPGNNVIFLYSILITHKIKCLTITFSNVLVNIII